MLDARWFLDHAVGPGGQVVPALVFPLGDGIGIEYAKVGEVRRLDFAAFAESEHAGKVAGQPPILRCAAVYGANASGKSNLVKALAFARRALSLPGGNTQRAHEALAAALAANGLYAEAITVIERLLEDACKQLFVMRENEGAALRTLLLSLGQTIQTRLDEVRERAPEVSRLYGERLKTRMATMLAEAGIAARQEDVLREVATFAERADIAEEIQRLGGHLQAFRKLLDPANPEPIGRTLDFLAQEMLREANTIASKASDFEIATRVVDMKTAIDRIKEQAANAE
jgi:hypothetical protein